MEDDTTSPKLRQRGFFCIESYLPTVLKSIERWGASNFETRLVKPVARKLRKGAQMIFIECPKCKGGPFERVGGKRPGWECQRCGIFYPEQTWTIDVDKGSLKRKWQRKKYNPRKSYSFVNFGDIQEFKKAVSGFNQYDRRRDPGKQGEYESAMEAELDDMEIAGYKAKVRKL